MPIFFLIVGLLLVVVGINDRLSDLGSLLKEDFKPNDGSKGFAVWILVIALLGLISTSKTFKPVGNAFLALVVIAMLLANKGFFGQFANAVQNAGSGSNPSDNQVVGADNLGGSSSDNSNPFASLGNLFTSGPSDFFSSGGGTGGETAGTQSDAIPAIG